MTKQTPLNHLLPQRTRGHILELLRRGQATVGQLAAALQLTPNAVRSHLAALQRDGLVHPGGFRPGARKPHRLFRLAPPTQRLLARADHRLLGELLATLPDCLPESELQALYRRLGQRLAAPHLPALAGLDPPERLARAIEILGDLGGSAELVTRRHATILRGRGCPFATAVSAHPGACQIMESLLSELLGTPVRECCRKGPTPRCRFAWVAPSGEVPASPLAAL